MLRRPYKTFANPPALAGNTILNPYALDDASWTQSNVAYGTNSHLAPDMSMNADLVVATNVTDFHNITQPNTDCTGGYWMFRARFKRAGYNHVFVNVGSTGGYAKYVAYIFHIGTGLAVYGAGVDYVSRAVIKPLPNQWWLFDIIIQNADANSTHRIDIFPARNTIDASYTGDGVSGFYGWGVEFAPVPT